MSKDILKRLDTEPNQAMEELVAEYTALVWHVASKYLWNAEDVKECVNETFTEVYVHRAEYDEEKGSLAVWIGTIARYRAISMYRKLRKEEMSVWEEAGSVDMQMAKSSRFNLLREELSRIMMKTDSFLKIRPIH